MKHRTVNEKVFIERLVRDLGMIIPKHGFIHCPFHDDPRPSLKIYGKSKGWFCFECHAGGGSVEFYAGFRRISKQSAVNILARLYQIDDEIDVSFKKREVRYDQIIDSWERKLSKKILDIIFNIEYLPFRRMLYDAWETYGVEVLERTAYLVKKSGTFGHLRSGMAEISDFLVWVVDLFLDAIENGKSKELSKGWGFQRGSKKVCAQAKRVRGLLDGSIAAIANGSGSKEDPKGRG